jgi:hypothetical protein
MNAPIEGVFRREDMAGAAEESPERGQAVMAGLFETIPVDRQGRGRSRWTCRKC